MNASGKLGFYDNYTFCDPLCNKFVAYLFQEMIAFYMLYKHTCYAYIFKSEI